MRRRLLTELLVFVGLVAEMFGPDMKVRYWMALFRWQWRRRYRSLVRAGIVAPDWPDYELLQIRKLVESTRKK